MKRVATLFCFFLLIYLVDFLLVSSCPETSPGSCIGDTVENLVGVNIVNSEPCSAWVTEESISSGTSSRTYSWEYKRGSWQLTLPLDDELYESYKARTRNRDYDLFASDPYDDWLIKEIANSLISLSKSCGLEESEIPGFCVSFVQSLNYTSDLQSSGYEQYPRFPYETLYEGGGDCEDTAILSVALLQEIGCDVVLLELPEHMALGIKCSPEQKGRSFEYEGNNYYYLETTGTDWHIGEIPEEYEGQPVRVIPVSRRPKINLDFKAQCKYSRIEGIVDVSVTAINVGSEKAENTTFYVALQAKDQLSFWDEIESSPVVIEPEGVYNYTAKGLKIPAGKEFRIYVQAFGENFVSEDVISDWARI
ncbi:MAG: hypothetical protein ACHQXK_08685 [Methanosarcina thermophila]|uniref:Transglutaminase-like domain-containing protein n=1 Tax=Methanosarcina thermophila TaxID=2210 RepID=A0A1I6XCX2_METTE|nr:hypothetical protein [Methanosarcina thermophila]ALK04536.1 MAG: hypothetical protein AAY43_01005 [Methanosarcina sp. 795]NLU57152.1 hypothetical protein [Methanosarcina thermophila]SFT35674.1 hypothetical protein SAMN02910340_00378 [Methanosarcina thermophila]HOQ64394.1 hypothetical protein [Methanosarcina thermophila]HPT79624.1 hypothetical protein [Methanosarcina thermophila]